MAKKKTSTEDTTNATVDVVVEAVAEKAVEEVVEPIAATANLALADLGIKNQSAGKQVIRRVETTLNGREIIVESYK